MVAQGAAEMQTIRKKNRNMATKIANVWGNMNGINRTKEEWRGWRNPEEGGKLWQENAEALISYAFLRMHIS